MKNSHAQGIWPCRTCHFHSALTGQDFCTHTNTACPRPKSGCADFTPPREQGADIRVLVCGPVNYSDRARFGYALDMAWRRRRIAQVVHWGGQVGRLAEGWCTIRGIGVRDLGPNDRRVASSVEAENSYVLETATPQGVIVFPGESHRVGVLMGQLHGAGIPVWHPFGE